LFSVTMDVEVEAIRLLPNSNNVRAYVDIRIGQPYGWLIRDFRVLKTDGHKYLVNGPQTSWRIQPAVRYASNRFCRSPTINDR